MNWLFNLYAEYWDFFFVQEFEYFHVIFSFCILVFGFFVMRVIAVYYCDYFSQKKNEDKTALDFLLLIILAFLVLNAIYFNLWTIMWLIPIGIFMALCFGLSKIKVGHLIPDFTKYKIRIDRKD